MDSYYGTCALCIHFDLYEKWLGKYYCTVRKTYYTVNEKQCSSFFVQANPIDARIEMVEKARAGRL